MDRQKRLCAAETWTKLPTPTQLELQKKVPPDQQFFINFSSQQNMQKWDDPSILDSSRSIGEQFPECSQPSRTPCTFTREDDNQMRFFGQDGQMNGIRDAIRNSDWDPKVMLTNLSIMEQKIHQLQDLVHMIFDQRTEPMNGSEELAAQQQQLINADLTSIIVQLISTAGSLLPSVKSTFPTSNPFGSQHEQDNGIVYPSGNNNVNKVEDHSKQNDHSRQNDLLGSNAEEHDLKDEEEVDDGEHLPPGSYEILQLEKEEILAPHTHFCLICGKGFKRDANLRMHMRGHGDEYKTAAALAKPHKEMCSEPSLVKRYSCPYIGCKRNKDHKKFQPLKTILCVKNHYKRTHCDKSYTCSRCNTKKFSVLADLKTHEKHCGRDRWLCSCGTTFSRKDKLFGHIGLFQGHTPAIPLDENKGLVESPDHGEANEGKVALTEFHFSSNDFQNIVDEDTRIFSPLDFDTGSLSGFNEFPRPPFEDSVSSLSFLISGACNYPRDIGRSLDSNNL